MQNNTSERIVDWYKYSPHRGPQGMIDFLSEICGLPVNIHPGQTKWVLGSTRVINILKPANQWGKTAIVAGKHLYSCVFKKELHKYANDMATWKEVPYETLNVGKTYEVAMGVWEAVRDICEGRMLLPTGSTNESKLKGWAITRMTESKNNYPEIEFWNGAKMLIRSYNDLGSAFKRKKLAYVSSDECGDIPELKLFLTGTMLPRVNFFQGQIDLIGTSQPQGVEYEELAQEAQDKMEREKDGGPVSDMYYQTGSVFENPFLDKSFIKRIESVADPELRRQIIYGEYVDYAEHFYNFDEVSNMFGNDMDWEEESGIAEPPDPKGYYVFSVDMSAGTDETVATCVRYNITTVNNDKSVTEHPYRIVFHKGFIGKTIPLSMQYEMIRSWYKMYKDRSSRTKFVFDAQSLGGKNTQEAFADLYGSPFPPVGKSPAKAKAEALGTFKEVIGRGRKVIKDPTTGKFVDLNKGWGFIQASPKMKALRKQLETYRVDDRFIRQDRVISLVQAIHYIEMRRPRTSRNRAVDINLLKGTIGRY